MWVNEWEKKKIKDHKKGKERKEEIREKNA